LVRAENANVDVTGKNTETSKLTAGSAVAIVATLGTGTPNTLGGDVYVNGGLISGVTGAIVAQNVWVTNGSGQANSVAGPEYPTLITTNTGLTISAIAAVVVNNASAVIRNESGGASTAAAPSAVIYSVEGAITVVNVDSVWANSQATGLLTVKPGNGVNVFRGKVKSRTGYAINSAGDVLVDKVSENSSVLNNNVIGQK